MLDNYDLLVLGLKAPPARPAFLMVLLLEMDVIRTKSFLIRIQLNVQLRGRRGLYLSLVN